MKPRDHAVVLRARGTSAGTLTKKRRNSSTNHARQDRQESFPRRSPASGQGEELTRAGKTSILADAYEALIGAIFLDSSFDEAARIVERHFEDVLGPIEEVSITDYKSLLLEICQSRFKCLPRVVVVDEIGPEHDKEFVVNVELEGRVVGRGRGRNKKQAAQNACKEALRSLDYPLS